MSNFWKRAITGTLFVVVMVGGIMWNYWSLCALFLLIAMLGLNEFYNLIEQGGIQPQKWIGMGVGALLFMSAILSSLISPAFIFLVIPFIVAIFFAELFRDKANPFQNIAYTIVGIIYVVFPFAAWVALASPGNGWFQFITSNHYSMERMREYNPHILLGFFVLLWTNDTGAYVSGMTLGRHKLWERISPKKTWEGFIGGIILSVVLAYFLSIYFKEMSLVLWIIMALVVSIFGTLGDLVESMFKRSLNVKESGDLLPGHGGILDRFDGVLLTTPLIVSGTVIIYFVICIADMAANN